MRVLAVDDDPQALRYVRDALAGAGCQPVVTGGPEEAVCLMEEERPRLGLLDLMLPDADGIELMQAILEIEDVPVIFISALRAGGPHRPGFRPRGRGLRGQALLAHGAYGPDPGGPAPARGAHAVGTLCVWRPDR